MRLGASFLPGLVEPFIAAEIHPDRWVAELRQLGYRAAPWPLPPDSPSEVIDEYAQAARRADIVISEVPIWNNPISPDDDQRRAAIRFSQEQLALAERVGARCCINLSGSRSLDGADAPHPANLTGDTFTLVVDTIREIIDAVNPVRAAYAVEMMPILFPHSPNNARLLIDSVQREQFAINFDVVNFISSPERYYATGELIRECVAKFGDRIKSCHAKDTVIVHEWTIHISETRPGLGALDFRALLRALDGLGDRDLPIMIEHLATPEDYREAAEHIRGVAREVGVLL